jgi:mRNA-degrading endonuclease RelE of RelBE toxin-antitoxin system
MASYRVEVAREVRNEIRSLPGNVRQRVVRALRVLEADPRPADSRLLDPIKAGIELEEGVELHRIRMASWRIVYLIEEEWELVSVLAIRKRPPYQYDDLSELVLDSQ